MFVIVYLLFFGRATGAMTTKPKNRREQILHEATRLFAQHGFTGTSLRVIAKACAITEAAIYRHFPSKIALYEAVIHRKADQHDIARFLEKSGGQGDIEMVLTTVAEHILGFIETDPELLRLMHANSLESGPVAAVLFKEVRLPYISYLTRELKRRIAAHEVCDIDPFITSRCFIGMVMDCALSVDTWSKISDFEFIPGDVICNNVPIFAKGLTREPTTVEIRQQPGRSA